jgi:hypothetical protein
VYASSPRLAAIDRDQVLLRPVDVEKLIDEDHGARSIGSWWTPGSTYHAQIEAVDRHHIQLFHSLHLAGFTAHKEVPMKTKASLTAILVLTTILIGIDGRRAHKPIPALTLHGTFPTETDRQVELWELPGNQEPCCPARCSP